MKKLELVREEKLFRLIPGRTKNSRLEASGVALVNDSTAFIVFDNLNQIARVDVSLKRSPRNGLLARAIPGRGVRGRCRRRQARIDVRPDRVGRGS